MHLSDEDIAEFRRIWRQKFGEEISAEEARARAREVLELYVLLYLGRDGGHADSQSPDPEEPSE